MRAAKLDCTINTSVSTLGFPSRYGDLLDGSGAFLDLRDHAVDAWCAGFADAYLAEGGKQVVLH
jgi:hypothetical protein